MLHPTEPSLPSRISAVLSLLTALAVLLCITFLAVPRAEAQSTFPLPGISSGGTDSADAPPEDGAPVTDPTAALIDILRDDAARAALIEQLEAATTEPPQTYETSPPSAAPYTEATPAPEAEPANLSTRIVHALRTEVAGDIRDFFSRVKRIPTTLELALRGFEADVLSRILNELLIAVAVSYGALIGIRLALRPGLKALDRKAGSGNIVSKYLLRIFAIALLALVIPIAGAIGVAAVSLTIDTSTTYDDAGFSTAQTAFFAAFIAVEFLKLPTRFVLSPRFKDMRLVMISDKAARKVQTIVAFTIVLAGYGQLVAVPVVTEETSIFIGRAVATLLGTIVVLYLFYVVFRYREPVGHWFTRNHDADATLDEVLSYFAVRWHWPVLIYLSYLMVVVLTRPGNVLGPLAADTLRVLAIFIIGGVATVAARNATQRRVTLPQPVQVRLPLLAGRLNRLLPAALLPIRLAIVLLVVLSILDVFGAFDFSGFLASSAGTSLLSSLLGVALAAVLVMFIYIALSSWVDYQLNPFVGKPPTPRLVTLLTLLRNAVTIVLVIVAGMFALSELGLNIGPLLASAGVLGLAISFGAQKLVEDIITGIFIQFENAMNVGDVVDVGGVVGTVEKLTVRSVTLRDLQGVVHMIPFSSAAMISNYMREFSYYVCDMGVAYRENIEMSKQAMFDAFEELREDEEQGGFLLGDLEWFGLNSFGDSAIVLRARIKTQPGKQWGVGRAYNLILKRIFDEREIEIPFPHQTIYFGEDRKGKAPPVHVMMQTSDTEVSKAHPVAEAIPDARGPETLDVPSSDGDDPGR